MNWTDKPWYIEQRGIEQVDDTERHGNARELFYIWFAANIGFLGMLYGAIIVSYHLTFWQGVIAAVLGSTSFFLVGIFGVVGKDTGRPMLMAARRPFGSRGNVLPALVSWVNLLGWETIVWVTASDAVLSLLQAIWKFRLGTFGTTIIFLCLGAGTFLIALYGHATIVKVQKWISLIFGISTLAVIVELFAHDKVHLLKIENPDSFASDFLPAVALIILGTGLSWVTTASDYTRYLPAHTSSIRITLTTFFGAAIPLVVIVVSGMLLTPVIPGFSTSSNPLSELGAGLPHFWVILFWITATVGLLTENILAIYSSGLTLQTMYVRIPRPWTSIVEFLITGSVGLYFLLSNSSLFDTLQTFLGLIGSTLAPWAGIMLIDILTSNQSNIRNGRSRMPKLEDPKITTVLGMQGKGHWNGFGIPALVSWLLGIVTILAFASSPMWNGPFAKSIMGMTQLGFLVGFLVSFLAYGISQLILASTP